MSAVSELDSIRTTVAVEDIFDGRRIPAGATGAVVEVYPDGTCLVDIALRPQTDTDPGDFVQAELKPGQYVVIATWRLRPVGVAGASTCSFTDWSTAQ